MFKWVATLKQSLIQFASSQFTHLRDEIAAGFSALRGGGGGGGVEGVVAAGE